MIYVESNVRMGKGRDLQVWPAPMKHRFPPCGAYATRCLRPFGYSACERKGSQPTSESAVGLVGPLHGNCCVRMARCGQGVHIGVKIDKKIYDVDVRRMSSCCALRGAENTVRKN
jgi:hypothetical protein